MRTPRPLGERLDERRRLLVAALLGAVAAVVAAPMAPWVLTVLVAWDAAALFLVGSVWSFLPVLDAVATASVATGEDDSRAAVDIVVVAASLVSLVGVVIALVFAKNHSGTIATVVTAVAVFTVFLSWFTVHTLFTLRYARLYYSDPVGGIDFAGSRECPDYLDFAYVAFTIGMTFQVSDTNIGKRTIRRAIVRHSLLSYVFGTVVVGVTIGVLSGLIR